MNDFNDALRGQLYGLLTLKGTVSEGRLLKAGFSKAAIGRAVSMRGLRRVSEGMFAVNPSISRKLLRLVERELTPGEEVFRYREGRISKAQVVKDDGQKVMVVDPEQRVVDDAEEDEIIPGEEIEKLKT